MSERNGMMKTMDYKDDDTDDGVEKGIANNSINRWSQVLEYFILLLL